MNKSIKSPTVIPEQIHLKKVSVFKSQFDSSEKFLDNPVPIITFRTKISQEQGHNINSEMVRVRLYISLDGLDEIQQKVGFNAVFGIDFHYQVDNLINFFKENNEGKMEQDIQLAATLLSVSISTARGIILERTNGTSFNGVILPVVDAVKILLAKE
jgi:hypothetical protein